MKNRKKKRKTVQNETENGRQNGIEQINDSLFMMLGEGLSKLLGGGFNMKRGSPNKNDDDDSGDGDD